ncbi:MAG: hypothetical protein V3V45_00700 [Candidatus Brocadiales bacterium]
MPKEPLTKSMSGKCVKTGELPELGLALHTQRKELYYLIVLGAILALLASIFPLILLSSYKGSADLHATLEVVGASLGINLYLMCLTWQGRCI